MTNNGVRCLSRLLIAILVNSLIVGGRADGQQGQQGQQRILVPEERKSAEKKRDEGPQVARPELVLQTGVTVPAAIVAYSPDGQLIASMSFQGGAIKLWEVATGRELRNLNLGPRGAFTTALNSAFVFGKDGKTLISVSAGTLKEWDTSTGRELKSIALNAGKDFGAVALSADGRWLAAPSQSKNSLAVREVSTGREVQKLTMDLDGGTTIHAFALSPDGSVLATGEESHTGGDSTTLVLRDVSNWRVLRTIKLTEEKTKRISMADAMKSSQPLRLIRFSPDGRTLAMAIRDVSYEQAMGTVAAPRATGQENTIRLWDVASGRELRSIAVSTAPGKPPSAGTGEYSIGHGLAFSPDGATVAAVSNEQTAKLFEVSTGRHTSTMTGHDGDITAVAFSLDGRQAVTAGSDSTIRIWDLSTASSTGRIPLVRTFGGNAMPVSSLAYATDGRTLAVSGAQTVSMWEFTTGTSLRTLEIPASSSKGLEDLFVERSNSFFSEGGQYVAAGTDSGELKVWETRTAREVQSVKLQSGKLLSGGILSADGKLLAVPDRVSQTTATTAAPPAQPGATKAPSFPFPMPGMDPSGKKDDKKRSKDMEKQQREALKEMEKMAKSGQMPIGMPDMSQMQKVLEAAQRGEMGKMQETMGQVMAGLPQGMIPEMKPPVGIRLLDVAGGKEIRSLPGSKALGGGDRASVALTLDGRLIASATDGHRINIHDVATGRELFTLSSDRAMQINQIAFSPDGRLLAASTMETKPGLDMTQLNSDFSVDGFFTFVLRLWDISDPAAGAREVSVLNGHSSSIRALSFSPDGRTLASAGFDATVRLWDLKTGRAISVLSGHTLSVTALSFSADGKQLVSGSDDGSTRLWQTETGELLATLITLNRGADWLVVTPDGLFDGTPGAWSQILWRFSPNIFDVTPVEVFFNEFYYPGLLTAIYSGSHPRAAQDVSQKDRRQPTVKLARADGQPDGVVAATRTINVRVEVSAPASNAAGATSAGAGDVRLFRNGSLVKVWRGDVLKGQNQVALEATLPIVAGENRLTAYAFNRDNVKSIDAAFLITGAPELQRKGTLYILAFGVNRYANEQYNLKYAVADATSFADEVRAQQTKLGQYERVSVITLSDADATKENILTALKGLSSAGPVALPTALAAIKPAQPEDAVIIYFAGHGAARGARFYLVPHDLGYTGSRTGINAQAVETILTHSISDLELEGAFEGLDAERLLLVIDACNSGQALEAEEKRRGPMNSKGLAQLAYEKGIYILTAAQSYQAALEAAELGHGYLTFALVEEGLKRGLADRDMKDGQILGREWFNYATERVPQMQEKGMLSSRLLLFVDGEESLKDPAKRSIQRPRVFYRRELEARPLIVAKP